MSLTDAHFVIYVGVVLYELFSNEKLFPSTTGENIVQEYMHELYNFDDHFRRKKLKKIKASNDHGLNNSRQSKFDAHSPAALARNLISQLLTKDPHYRPRMEQGI
jgi:serine/threonine protein kinase